MTVAVTTGYRLHAMRGRRTVTVTVTEALTECSWPAEVRLDPFLVRHLQKQQFNALT
jgi:hypothetical protein